MHVYVKYNVRAEARRTAGKLVSSFGSFGPNHATADAARASLRIKPWYDDSDPTTVVHVKHVATGPRSMRFQITTCEKD